MYAEDSICTITETTGRAGFESNVIIKLRCRPYVPFAARTSPSSTRRVAACPRSKSRSSFSGPTHKVKIARFPSHYSKHHRWGTLLKPLGAIVTARSLSSPNARHSHHVSFLLTAVPTNVAKEALVACPARKSLVYLMPKKTLFLNNIFSPIQVQFFNIFFYLCLCTSEILKNCIKKT